MNKNNKRKITAQQEMRIYELLGITHFRNFLLWLEKIKHRKSGDRNANYHIGMLTTSAMKAFSGYLAYNTLIHVISTLLILACFVIAFVVDYPKWWFASVALVMLVANIYCILLQRYLHLKLGLVLQRKLAHDERKKRSLMAQLQSSLDLFSAEALSADLSFLNRLFHCAQNGENCVITEADAASLNRMSRVLSALEKPYAPDNRPLREIGVGPAWVLKSQVQGKTERRVSMLQNLLKVQKEENVLFGFCVITESAQVERQFVSVFSSSSRDRLHQTLALLMQLYTEAINRAKGMTG